MSSPGVLDGIAFPSKLPEGHNGGHQSLLGNDDEKAPAAQQQDGAAMMLATSPSRSPSPSPLLSRSRGNNVDESSQQQRQYDDAVMMPATSPSRGSLFAALNHSPIKVARSCVVLQNKDSLLEGGH
jgi:hypothetical protein